MSTTITVYNAADTSVDPPEAVQVLIVNNNATAIVAGVPSGGTTGQILIKSSNANFDTEWHTSTEDPTLPARVSAAEYDIAELRDVDAGLSAEIAAIIAADTVAMFADMAGADLVLDETYSGASTIQVINAPASGTGVLTLTVTDDTKTDLTIILSGSYDAVLALSTGEVALDNNLFRNTFSRVDIIRGVAFSIERLDITEYATQYSYKKVLSSHGAYSLQQSAQAYTDNALVAPLGRISQTEYDVADLQASTAALESRASVIEYDIAEIRDTIAESVHYGMLFEYKAKTNATSGDPTSGKILWNNATQTSATSLNISHLTIGGVDIDPYIDALKSGDILHLQSKTDHTQFQKWTVNGTHTHHSGYCTISVALDSSGGIPFSNNQEILLGVVYSAAEIQADITALENRASVIEYDIAELRDVDAATNETLNAAYQALVDHENRISTAEYDIAESRDVLAEHTSDIILLENRASVIEYDIAEVNDDLLTVTQIHVGTSAPEDTRKLWVDTDDTATDAGWKDLVADASRANASGGGAPTWAVMVSGIYAYRFSATATNEIWLTFHVPHDVKPNTRLIPHFHWCSSGTNTGNCRWGLEYSYAKRDNTPNRVFPASTTVYALQAGSGSALAHQIVEIPNPDTDGILVTEPDGLIMCRAFRDGANAADTLTDAAFLLSVDLHYQSDREGTPSRDPSYY